MKIVAFIIGLGAALMLTACGGSSAPEKSFAPENPTGPIEVHAPCDNFRNTMRDLDKGLLTFSDFQWKAIDIYDEALFAPPDIMQAAVDLRDATVLDVTAIPKALRALGAACVKYGA